MKESKQMSESFLVGALLTVAGGFLDAYTYLFRGGVFANAQTGNIVLLGVRLAEGQWRQALYYLVPISTFALGVLAAEGIRQRLKTARGRFHWRQAALGLEIMVLLGVLLVPQGKLDTLVNVLVSFVCAVQVESFRKIAGNAVATTMCTGNLRSGMELLAAYLATGDRTLLRRCGQYVSIIGFFILGAVLGACMAGPFGALAPVLPVLLLAAAFAAMFVIEKEKEEQHGTAQ